MRALISIDWDFFVYENPLWDLQHNETGMHIKTLWSLRGHLRDLMKTDGNEQGFWDRLQEQAKLKDVPIYVSESHSFAFQVCLLQKPELVVSFDTHHDLWPRGIRSSDVFCHNWLRAFLQASKHHRAIWVYPKHSAGLFKMPRDKIASRCQRRPDPYRLPAGTEIEAIHICRSGAWTPPWLDEQFGKFVAETEHFSRFLFVDEVKDEAGTVLLNPLLPRWSEEDARQAQVFQETISKQHERLVGLDRISKAQEIQQALESMQAIVGEEEK